MSKFSKDDKRGSFGKTSSKYGSASRGKSSGNSSRPNKEGGSSFKKRDDSFSERPKRSFGESKPRFERGGEGGSSFGKRDDSFSERPKRSFGESKPRFERGGEGGSSFKRRDDSFSERPKRSFGESKPRFERGGEGGSSFKRRDDSFSERPKRSFGDEKPRFERKPADAFHKPAKKFFKSSDTNDSKPRFEKKEGGFGSEFSTDKRKNYESRNGSTGFKKDFGTDEKRLSGIKKSFSDKKTESLAPKTDKEGIRINRYIANAGVCSRREADQLIIEGLIKINGKVVTELGVIVKPEDTVKYGNKILNPEKPMYVLLNKPKDFITTTNDPQERNTVMNLVANACKERIYPVGRLDRNTTGLLLFTNDGELAERLTHPSYKIKKIYQVEVNRPVSVEDAEAILDGLYFEEGKAVVDSLAFLDASRMVMGIEIHIGWNRIVRRIFEAKGYDVVKLDRVLYASLTKKDLPRGKYRFLTEKEIISLKHFL
jgi:23S rRNA pseudouridine2605 synthase